MAAAAALEAMSSWLGNNRCCCDGRCHTSRVTPDGRTLPPSATVRLGHEHDPRPGVQTRCRRHPPKESEARRGVDDDAIDDETRFALQHLICILFKLRIG
jgi:hypothetical protein